MTEPRNIKELPYIDSSVLMELGFMENSKIVRLKDVEALLRRTIKDYDDMALSYHKTEDGTGNALQCKVIVQALKDLLGERRR